MGKIVNILLLSLVVFSCKKDKVPLPCHGVSMSGDRSVFVGKWVWYKTRVTEWFDIGPDVVHEYTPQNQNFEYFFTISTDGEFKAYEDNNFVKDAVLSAVDYEYFDGSFRHVMTLNFNCSNSELQLGLNTPLENQDSIDVVEFPFNFNDEENHLYSNGNYFVRE